MIRSNYHTHTERCRHASGTVRDYCAAALDAGLEVLGFSDHAPLPGGRWQSVRMAEEELPEYCADIDRARPEFPDLRILRGLELEFDPERPGYGAELREAAGLDYLVGAAHWYPLDGGWRGVHGPALDAPGLRAYAAYVATSIADGGYLFFAHPDLFGYAYPAWDAETEACARCICEASVSYGVPLEINGYGFRKPPLTTPSGTRPRYPWPPFWRIAAEYGVRVVLSSDAHEPGDIVAGIPEARAIALQFGLEEARFDHLSALKSPDREPAPAPACR